jgi:hypothetical protein
LTSPKTMLPTALGESTPHDEINRSRSPPSSHSSAADFEAPPLQSPRTRQYHHALCPLSLPVLCMLRPRPAPAWRRGR